MKDEELKRIEDEGCGCAMYLPECVARELVAEVRRLRGLVKIAEWLGPDMGRKTYSCPWCEACFAPDEDRAYHDADCPAFAATGDVR